MIGIEICVSGDVGDQGKISDRSPSSEAGATWQRRARGSMERGDSLLGSKKRWASSRRRISILTAQTPPGYNHRPAARKYQGFVRASVGEGDEEGYSKERE
jgi:hypothetical protein